ncbi:membrane protein insertion efficiency factor YidD [Catenovulum sp. SM1970]|uniref:membrane protein insertion efficiency factor YidD n=1 Tax=Marinifaba aquimaris TaxID=2741323 RepID=UPI001574237F|nr:membrane protein insertion efficiency factor YidD [Marinifaba aquimaris]NTS76350.1 membrane protein insertion efficiency factor YidD [Marinifaba aquimaris]
MAKIKKICQQTVILPIRFYQVAISPMLGPNCRFTPTCSQYAITAIEKHGIVKGTWLASRRILKCHPNNPGGYDPVPEKIQKSQRD